MKKRGGFKSRILMCVSEFANFYVLNILNIGAVEMAQVLRTERGSVPSTHITAIMAIYSLQLEGI